MLNAKKGFTLIELLVVISIIALLSSIVTVAAASARVKTLDFERANDILQIKTALTLYAIDHNGQYPAIPATNPGTGWGYTDCIGIATYNPTNPYCWGGNGTNGSISIDGGQYVPGYISVDNALAPYLSALPRDPSHKENSSLGAGYLLTSDPNDNFYQLMWGVDGCYTPKYPSSVLYNQTVCDGGTLQSWGSYFGGWGTGFDWCENVCTLQINN